MYSAWFTDPATLFQALSAEQACAKLKGLLDRYRLMNWDVIAKEVTRGPWGTEAILRTLHAVGHYCPVAVNVNQNIIEHLTSSIEGRYVNFDTLIVLCMH